LGTVFGLQAKSRNDDAKTHCPRGTDCDDAQGPALSDDARHAAVLSNVAFGVGGVALLAGGILYLTTPAKTSSSALQLSIRPLAGTREVGASMTGSF
jgi:serine/threonine-protein kinase